MNSPMIPRQAGAVAEVRLNAVAHNWNIICARALPAQAAPVLKADAYGLGMEAVAKRLQKCGATRFCVFSLDEGLRLRAILPKARILILGGLPRGTAPDLIAARLLPALSTLGQLEEWRGAARKAERTLPTALHLETGLNRYAISEHDVRRIAAAPERLLQGLGASLWMSHLSSAEHPSAVSNREQRVAFCRLTALLPPAPTSLANSAGIWLGRAFRFDWVRPGAALYGIEPGATPSRPFQFAIQIHARVIQVKAIARGAAVGYNSTWRAPRNGRLATLQLGYADGLATVLSNRGAVWYHGRRLPIRGRISMDLTTVDATSAPSLRAGEWVELLAPHDERGDLLRLAERTQQVSRDILTGLGERVVRVYSG